MLNQLSDNSSDLQPRLPELGQKVTATASEPATSQPGPVDASTLATASSDPSSGQAISAPLNSGSSSANSVPPAKSLPYQPTHQVELLNLQAETEALLQHLYCLQRQRELCLSSETSASTSLELPQFAIASSK